MKKFFCTYKCLKCEHKWKVKIKNSEQTVTNCVKCGHKYVKWLNYEKLEKEIFSKEQL